MSRTELLACARQIVIPLFDLRAGRDLEAEWARARERIAAGFGGLILFGGRREELAGRLPQLKESAPPGSPPPLIGADLERGLGQQVEGGTQFPPAMALGASASPELVQRAGRLLAREAGALGIDWIFAPVLDLAFEPGNPIVGTRSFGASPELAAELGAAFARGIQEGGVLACGKHFPGHGATTSDSHDALPVVDLAPHLLMSRDLAPFTRAIRGGVGSLMTAHVAYPQLASSRGGDPSRPATLNPTLVQGLLRDELGFEGVVVTDALIMEGAHGEGGEAPESTAARLALGAGCDVILYPNEPEQVVAGLADWAEADQAHAARLREAATRFCRVKESLSAPLPPPSHAEGAALALELSCRALTRLGDAQTPLASGQQVGVLILDDDDLPCLGHELLASLSEAGVVCQPVTLGATPSPAGLTEARRLRDAQERLLVVIGCRVRAWKGRPGLTPPLQELLRTLPSRGLTVVGLCGPYPLGGLVPTGAELLLAYGDEACSQQAAVTALLGGEAPGQLPVQAFSLSE